MKVIPHLSLLHEHLEEASAVSRGLSPHRPARVEGVLLTRRLSLSPEGHQSPRGSHGSDQAPPGTWPEGKVVAGTLGWCWGVLDAIPELVNQPARPSS